jgi:Putative polyhydroxyalkanoic acid system protein (PHA_gran_rgn)
MRVTIPHNKSKEEVIQAVDGSIDGLLKQAAGLPVKIADPQRSWQGSTMNFSLVAKMGLLSTPIKGMVDVTDHDVTIDVDLGILERMIPAEKAKEMIGSRVKGLLK